MENYNIFSTLMPVQIQWVAQNDTNYLITLDTGSPNTISAYDYQDWDVPANLGKCKQHARQQGWMIAVTCREQGQNHVKRML